MDRKYPGKTRDRYCRQWAISLALVGALAAAGPVSAERRLDIDRLEKSYVAALDLLAQGQREQALDALMALEIEALGKVPTAGRIDRVWRHKLAVVKRALELSSPELLVPVIVLHHDAYELYREAQQPVLARHARDMATDLATYKAQSSKSPEDKQFAGWVITSFGEALLDLRTSGTSAGILRDALDISPRNPAALLGLAWAHEIHGEYEDAVALLERLLEIQAGHDQARLRLAVCKRRLGELESAHAELTRLLNRATQPWIRSIVYQELARTLISLGRLEAAEVIARDGFEEMPGDQEIAILFASISERRGKPAKADAVVKLVKPVGEGVPSARYIYDDRPDLEIDEVRSTLHAMMEERLDVLASGLRWWNGDGAPGEGATEEGGGR